MERLVACLVDLAASADDVHARVEALIAASDPASSAALVRARLAALRRNRKLHWGFREAAAFSRRFDGILDLVEQSILPADPDLAFDLLKAFIETDAAAFEHADDSYGAIGGVFRRACSLFGAAARRISQDRVVDVLLHLWSYDEYGARGTLVRETAGSLDAAARASLIDQFRQQMHSAEQPVANPGSIGLMEIADAVGDPELYEEACLFGPRAGHPVFRLHTAQRYLRAGRAEEARTLMPERAADCGGYVHEWTATHIEILRALGRTEEVRACLWQQFTASPTKKGLDAWLATAAANEHAGMLARAREEALREGRDPAETARFFLDLGDAAEAARCVLRSAGRLDGEHYNRLAPLAEDLAAAYPIAASAIYRALVEGNLRPAKST